MAMHYDTVTTEVPAEVYRLPQTVIPQRYEIRLEPDLKQFVFFGSETITVSIHQPVKEIQLNALELEIEEAVVKRSGRIIPAAISLDPKLERARFDFDETLEPGVCELEIKFKGILNDKLHGFYRSHYDDAHGHTHMLASTQFEATDARRAFPCWDEPAAKAHFKVTLVIDDGLTAISNTGIESQHRLPNGKKEVTFKETIRMSTYLVAFIVGEFAASEPVYVGQTPLRIVHVPGKEALTAFPSQIGAFSLQFFADYYGIKYPGDKLDLVAIPDFASGAMENLGAITFRETALLVDEKTASRAELERVADVVSHENAHMWFGDLVTMRWWNGLWLNEAFATFMEMLAVDAWKPEWERWVSFGVSRAAAMGTDALTTTRPIEYTVRSPEEAAGMFDVLTYEKGAAVLRMLERYLGAEPFRKGISLYLHQHEYSNAETGDLWNALEQASGQPVRKMMDTWIFQPGFPIISVRLGEGGDSLVLGQQRFFYMTDEMARNTQQWQVPIMLRASTDRGLSEQKLILTAPETTVHLPGKVKWAVVNEGGHGFYRVRYTPELLTALTSALGQLSQIERFGLLSDTWAATVAGMTPLSEMLKLAPLFQNETDLNVWRALIAPQHYLEMILDQRDWAALHAEVRRLVGPAAERMGWTPKPGESELQSQLRATLLSTLGTLGDDHAVQAKARELYAQYKTNPDSVDRNLVPALIAIIAASGGPKEYRDFKESFKSARTPQEEQRYLFALADFTRPELLRQTMEMTINGEVRTQNAPYLMHDLLANVHCRYEAWEFLKRHWDQMNRVYPENAIPRMCGGITSLVDRQADVDQFFATHKVKQAGKTIEQHLERLRVAVAFKRREGAKLGHLLAGG